MPVIQGLLCMTAYFQCWKFKSIAGKVGKSEFLNVGAGQRRVDAEERTDLRRKEEKHPRRLQPLRQRQEVEERHAGRQVLVRPKERPRILHECQGGEAKLYKCIIRN